MTLTFGTGLGLAIAGLASVGLIAPDLVRGSVRAGGKPMSRGATRVLSAATIGLAGLVIYFDQSKQAPALPPSPPPTTTP